MRAEQIDASALSGWDYLSAASPRLHVRRGWGGGVLAVPQLPGHTERFRSPYPASRRDRRR